MIRGYGSRKDNARRSKPLPPPNTHTYTPGSVSRMQQLDVSQQQIAGGLQQGCGSGVCGASVSVGAARSSRGGAGVPLQLAAGPHCSGDLAGRQEGLLLLAAGHHCSCRPWAQRQAGSHAGAELYPNRLQQARRRWATQRRQRPQQRHQRSGGQGDRCAAIPPAANRWAPQAAQQALGRRLQACVCRAAAQPSRRP